MSAPCRSGRSRFLTINDYSRLNLLSLCERINLDFLYRAYFFEDRCAAKKGAYLLERATTFEISCGFLCFKDIEYRVVFFHARIVCERSKVRMQMVYVQIRVFVLHPWKNAVKNIEVLL